MTILTNVCVLLCLSLLPQETPGTPGQTTTAKQQAAAAPPAVTPKGEMPLKPMYLDKSLFLPDKRWHYDTGEEELPADYVVEQNTTVSLGGDYTLNHGAEVRYLVSRSATAGAAHQALQQEIQPGAPRPYVERKLHTRHLGDECYELEATTSADGEATFFEHSLLIRYGRYVVRVISSADMRAFGERPAHGERRWLCEAVFDAVSRAAQERWKNYRSLAPEKAAR